MKCYSTGAYPPAADWYSSFSSPPASPEGEANGGQVEIEKVYPAECLPCEMRSIFLWGVAYSSGGKENNHVNPVNPVQKI